MQSQYFPPLDNSLILLSGCFTLIEFKDNTHCFYGIKYWRNWWQSFGCCSNNYVERFGRIYDPLLHALYVLAFMPWHNTRSNFTPSLHYLCKTGQIKLNTTFYFTMHLAMSLKLVDVSTASVAAAAVWQDLKAVVACSQQLGVRWVLNLPTRFLP